jgi:tetrahydromethanopterin S-methyltransferase subunit B
MATSTSNIVDIMNRSLARLGASTVDINNLSQENQDKINAIIQGVSDIKTKVDSLGNGVTEIVEAKKNVDEIIDKIGQFPEGFDGLEAAIEKLKNVKVDTINLDELNEAVGKLESVVNPVAGIGQAPAPPSTPPSAPGQGQGQTTIGGKRNAKGGYVIGKHKKKTYSRMTRRSSKPKSARLSKTRKSTKGGKYQRK